MPARMIEPVARDLDLGGGSGQVADSSAMVEGIPLNHIVLYEHRDFEDRGRRRIIAVTEHQPQLTFSLHVMDFKDCLSSLRWNLEPGIIVQFSEHHQGGGRAYQIWGSGEDGDTHNDNFGDCASSWSWFRTAG